MSFIQELTFSALYSNATPSSEEDNENLFQISPTTATTPKREQSIFSTNSQTKLSEFNAITWSPNHNINFSLAVTPLLNIISSSSHNSNKRKRETKQIINKRKWIQFYGEKKLELLSEEDENYSEQSELKSEEFTEDCSESEEVELNGSSDCKNMKCRRREIGETSSDEDYSE